MATRDRTRSRDAYHELRRALLVGEHPLADRLAEVRLAEQLGTSRTPIREALLRLEVEGLVERRGGRGFYPKSPNLTGVRHLYELRRILELEAVLRPRRHGTNHDLDALRELQARWEALAAHPPEPDPGFVMVDESFHVGLAEAAGNRAIADHLRIANERIRVVRMQNFVDARRIVVTAEQHLAILDAVVKGDADCAVELLGAHLTEAMDQAAGRAAQAIERMLTAGTLLQAPVDPA